LAGERDALHAALRERQEEMTRLAGERDALQAASRERQEETARLAAERDALQAALRERQQETMHLTAERDALRAASDGWQAEASRLTAERDALQEQRAEAPRQSQTPPYVPAPVRESWRRRLARRAAKAAYMLVRPVARPIAWRLRSFMTGGVSDQLRLLSERIETLATHQPLTQPVQQPTVAQAGSDGAAAEMRRLAAEIERTLLTLALERAPDRWFAALSAPASPFPPPVPRVTLLLPHGRTAEVEHALRDVSVAASLGASGGDWEPHVRRYLEGIVRPDWVCLDIGANLGAHTLSLAVLAHAGRVVAFEADAANFRLLSRNAAALAPPRAAIEPVHVALWDRRGALVWNGADELAGCSFVTENPGDAAAIEQQLRAVVSKEAIDGVDLHVRHGEVPALPLDAWMDDNAPARLDVIKLDVKGAETRVIRGADATLRRYRPVLLVEYNPACASTHFGQPADALYGELAARFASIAALEPGGTLTPLADWPALQARLAVGRGWEDLVCQPER
jgi:FkbM family methyltransferase